MKIYIGFKADDMLVGSQPPPEEISVSEFRNIVTGSNWESRCAQSDTEHIRTLMTLTGISLPLGSTRLRYLAKGDAYIEVKIYDKIVNFFRYQISPAAI